MPNENDSGRKPSEKKTPPMGGNVVWYLLALCLGALLLFSMLAHRPDVDLPISERRKLVTLREPNAEEHNEYIDVVTKHDGKTTVVRYSKLQDLQVDDYAISGKITKQ